MPPRRDLVVAGASAGGQRWSPQRPVAEQSVPVERALWVAIRALEERGRLTGRLADAARDRGHLLSARLLADSADDARRSADAIRGVVNGMTTAGVPDPAEA